MRTILKSKIHRARISSLNPGYVGSIVIDQALMELVDLWEYEKVLVCDINNGQRFETYVIEGKPDSGEIEVHGAAARLCSQGDYIIIMAFEETDKPIKPKSILVDENNRFIEYL